MGQASSGELLAEVQEDGTVLFPNVMPEEYVFLDELGRYKDHEPIEGYEWLFRPHLCG
jgi:hypothetical protein